MPCPCSRLLQQQGGQQGGRETAGRDPPHTYVAASLQQHVLYLGNPPECGTCLRNPAEATGLASLRVPADVRSWWLGTPVWPLVADCLCLPPPATTSWLKNSIGFFWGICHRQPSCWCPCHAATMDILQELARHHSCGRSSCKPALRRDLVKMSVNQTAYGLIVFQVLLIEQSSCPWALQTHIGNLPPSPAPSHPCCHLRMGSAILQCQLPCGTPLITACGGPPCCFCLARTVLGADSAV